jgi:apolipoprotein N-acyltransferase
MTFVKEMGRKYGPILAGAMETSYSENGEVEYFNSSFLVDRKGQTDEIYRKQHLVPFGEYVPLEGVFPALERFSPLGWSCTAGSTSTVFRVPVSRTDFEDRTAAFSVLICFEDIFAYLSRDAVLSGAQLLINQTNDAWFDGSAGAEQHLSHCVFRAVENRVPVVRCANTGVTCGIDAAGRTRVFELEDGTRTGFEGAQAYRVRVPRADSGRTFYTRFGDVFFGLPCAVVSGVLTAFFMVRRRRECRLKRGSRIA